MPTAYLVYLYNVKRLFALHKKSYALTFHLKSGSINLNMWDLAKQLSHWKLSVRNLSLCATVMFVATFLWSVVMPTPVFAEEANWSGDTLTYQGKSFSKMSDAAYSKPLKVDNPDLVPYSHQDTTAKTLGIIYVHKPADGKPLAEATIGQYVLFKDFNPPDTFSGRTDPVYLTLTKVIGTATSEATAGSSCDSSIFQGLGWILCPVSNVLASAVDNIYKIISTFLVVTTLTTDQTSSVYKVWKIIVGLANLCFIFAFLYIVYIHLTSVNVERYHLFKKSLPRLLIAAILVNASYWICALGVDISNFLGYSVEQVFKGVRESVGLDVKVDWSAATGFILSAGTIGGFLGFAAATGGSFTAAGFLLISMLISVVLAALVAFIILAARQALIVIFIIIAPFAFVAWVLPNTEKYFQKWFKAFMTLLMMFPIFSALFGGSMLAGAAIMNSANGSLIIALIGMAVQIVPLVMTPLIIRFSTGLLGQIANMTNNTKRGLADRTRNWAQDNAKHHRLNKLSKNDNMVGRNPLLLGNPARLARSMDRSRRRREMMDKDNEDLLGNRADEDYQQRTLRSNRGQYQRMRNRRLDSHSMHERAAIYKAALDSQGEQHWAHELEANPELMSVKRRAHITTGQAKVAIDAIEKSNERALQESIDESRDLRKRIVQSGEDERRAQLVQQDLKNKTEAHWEHISRTDANVAAKRVETLGSEMGAAREKAIMDKLLTEVKAEGADAEIAVKLKDRLDNAKYEGVLNVARNVKSDNFEAYVEANAQKMAERSIAQNRAEILKKETADSAAIRVRAAGVLKGKGGEQSIQAQASRESSKFTVDDVENIQATTANEHATDVKWLLTQLTQNPDISFAERIAYSNLLAGAGAPGVSNLRKAIVHYDQSFSDKSASDLQDYKDFMRNNGKFMGAGKDLEFWATNTLDDNGVIKSFDNITRAEGTWSNISVDNFTDFNASSQLRMLQVLARGNETSRRKYNEIIDGLHKNDDMLFNKLKPAVRDAISRNDWASGDYAIQDGQLADDISPDDVDPNML